MFGPISLACLLKLALSLSLYLTPPVIHSLSLSGAEDNSGGLSRVHSGGGGGGGRGGGRGGGGRDWQILPAMSSCTVQILVPTLWASNSSKLEFGDLAKSQMTFGDTHQMPAYYG